MSAIRIEEDPEWARERYSVEGAMGVGGGDRNHSQGGVRGEEEEQRGKLREVTRNI